MHPVELGVFTNEESSRFIKQELKIEENNNLYGKGIEELAEKLQGLPLALQQAVAYIKQQRILDSSFGIKDYLEKYDKSYKEAERLLSYDLHKNNNDPYMKTVMTTWKVTLDKIASDTKYGKEAIRILSVMAYLVPDNIQNSMFSRLVEENKVAGPINLLRNYSMINQGSKSDLSNIHRLVQEVLRIDLKSKRKEEKTLEDAFSILDKKYNTRSGQQYNISNKDYKTMSAVLICMHASGYDSLHKRIEQLFESLVKKEKEQTRVIKEEKEIINNGELFPRYAVQEKNVVLVNLILNSMKNEWDNDYIQDLLTRFVDDDDVQKSEIIKFLISRIENIDRINVMSVIDNSNCMEVVKALAKLGKFNKEQKFQYLVEAIENANLDVVKFILEDEPSLVNEKLKENCFAYNDNNGYAYFVEEGSDILELARKVRGSLQKYKNIEKIIELIEEAKGKIRDLDRKEMDINHEKQSLTLGSELQSKMVGDTSDDEEELLDLDFEMIDTDDEQPPILEYCGDPIESLENNLNDAMEESPGSIVHGPSVTYSGQIHSRRY